MREVVTVACESTGNDLAKAFFKAVCSDHDEVAKDGRFECCPTPFFSDASRSSPRQVTIISGEKMVHRNSACIDAIAMQSEQDGGSDANESAVAQAVANQLEKCDSVDSFLLMSSAEGRMNPSVGIQVLKTLCGLAPKAAKVVCHHLRNLDDSPSVPECIGQMEALGSLAEFSDCAYIVDNVALANLSTDPAMRSPRYVNDVMSQVAVAPLVDLVLSHSALPQHGK